MMRPIRWRMRPMASDRQSVVPDPSRHLDGYPPHDLVFIKGHVSVRSERARPSPRGKFSRRAWRAPPPPSPPPSHRRPHPPLTCKFKCPTLPNTNGGRHT